MSEIMVVVITLIWLGLMLRGLLTGGWRSTSTARFFLSSAGQARSSKKQQGMANESAVVQMLLAKKAEKAALKEFEPWQGMEDQSRISMADLLGQNGPDAAAAAADALMNSPAVLNRLKTGTATIDRSRASRGGLFSGRTGVELQDMGQDIASEEYGNEFARRKSMMDWAYGNTANRAKIRGGTYADISGVLADKYNRLEDITKHKYDSFSKNSSEGMQLLGSMYGSNQKK